MYHVRDRALLQCMFINNGTFVQAFALYAVSCMPRHACGMMDNEG
jgi:hypothetical protein